MLMTQHFVLLHARASCCGGLQPREQNWMSQYGASWGGGRTLESGISQRVELQVR